MAEYDMYLFVDGVPVKPGIDTRVNALEELVPQIDAQVEAIDAQVKVIDAQVEVLEELVPQITTQIETLENINADERLTSIETPITTGSTTARTLQDRFADVVNVKDFGAKGDGVTNDTVAIQAALNKGGNIFFPAGVYCVSQLNVPTSVSMIDGNGATILRNTTSRNAFIFDNAENLSIKDLIVSCVDNTIHGGAFQGRNIKNVTLSNLRCIHTAPYDPQGGDWAITLSGSCIRMDGIYVESTEVGAWGDGVHLGWVEDFSLTNFDIHAGDDAIAFFQMPPYTGNWVNSPSRNIVVGHGFLQSRDYSCLKFGCNPRDENLNNSGSHWVQDALFHDIVFHNSTSFINVDEQTRTIETKKNAKYRNITFDNCLFNDFEGGRGFGNTDNHGAFFVDVYFTNCKIKRYKSSGAYISVYNIERLMFDSCVFIDTSGIKSTDFVITDCNGLIVKNCYFSQTSDLPEEGQLLQITNVPYICMMSNIIDAQAAFAAVALVSIPEEGKVFCIGNTIRGSTRSIRVTEPPENLSELLIVGNALTGSNGLTTLSATTKITG